jgi:hypothetical protein
LVGRFVVRLDARADRARTRRTRLRLAPWQDHGPETLSQLFTSKESVSRKERERREGIAVTILRGQITQKQGNPQQTRSFFCLNRCALNELCSRLLVLLADESRQEMLTG